MTDIDEQIAAREAKIEILVNEYDFLTVSYENDPAYMAYLKARDEWYEVNRTKISSLGNVAYWDAPKPPSGHRVKAISLVGDLLLKERKALTILREERHDNMTVEQLKQWLAELREGR